MTVASPGTAPGDPEALDAQPTPESATAGLAQLAKLAGSVVAPASMLTGLLYFFGWMHAYFYFDYFGVNSSALGFGTVYYLITSVDPVFWPATFGGAITLLALWGDRALRAWARTGPPSAYLRLVRIITAAGAALALGCGVLTVATGGRSGVLVALAPVGFALGVLVLAYAVNLRRADAGRRGTRVDAPTGGARPAEWMIVFLLVGISFFTAATDYAAGTGRTEALKVTASLPALPTTVIYSRQNLGLTGPGVSATRCRSPGAVYRYRYSGLVLIVDSNARYLLLPREWTAERGTAILLPESAPVRLEFYPGAGPAGAEPTC